MATTEAMLRQFLRLRRLEDMLHEEGLHDLSREAKALRTALHGKILAALLAEQMDTIRARAQGLRKHVRAGRHVTMETFFDAELGTWTCEVYDAETHASLTKVQGCESAEAARRAMDDLLDAAA